MKKIVLTGGGTSGHVTPNIALIPKLIEQEYEIHYIGSDNGIEKELIKNIDIDYYGIKSGKLRRYFDWKNFTDLFRIVYGFFQAFFKLLKLKPKLVFSKGGFVSAPVVWASWLLRIPVVIHESDFTPGLANKLSKPFAKKILYTFPETAKYLPGSKAEMIGLPVREVLFKGNREDGLRMCKFNGDKPVLLVTGGSLGSRSINEIVRNNLNMLLKKFDVVHLCGKGNFDNNMIHIEGYKQFSYVDEGLNHIFEIADIVVSRAGATTIFELLTLKKPNLLIPLPTTGSRGDQLYNAESFKSQGFSEVLFEEDLFDDLFLEKIDELYINKEKYIDEMKKSKLDGAVEKAILVINHHMK